MSAALIERSRVSHSSPLKSYGPGVIMRMPAMPVSADAPKASVLFDGEDVPRLVLLRDLSPVSALPLAKRVPPNPIKRVVYPVGIDDRKIRLVVL
ncbi:MAG: hypothetical protein K9G48_13805 [Reyranella sp.]|nr:hypothetical protein [Reyranella sp.]